MKALRYAPQARLAAAVAALALGLAAAQEKPDIMLSEAMAAVAAHEADPAHLVRQQRPLPAEGGSEGTYGMPLEIVAELTAEEMEKIEEAAAGSYLLSGDEPRIQPSGKDAEVAALSEDLGDGDGPEASGRDDAVEQEDRAPDLEHEQEDESVPDLEHEQEDRAPDLEHEQDADGYVTPEPDGDGSDAAAILLGRYIAAAVAASGGEEVLTAELRWWGDTSAGCPAEGMMYSQVVTEGAMIVTRGEDGERYWHGLHGVAHGGPVDPEVTISIRECVQDAREEHERGRIDIIIGRPEPPVEDSSEDGSP